MIAAGEVDAKAALIRSGSTVASCSSRCPTTIDGLIEPDIVGAGNKVISLSKKEHRLYTAYPMNCLLDPNGDNKDWYCVRGL